MLCLPGDQSHPFAQPTINPFACCICWAPLLGRAVFPPWNKGPNFGSYNHVLAIVNSASVNTGVHVSFQTIEFSFFPDVHPGVGSRDHVVALFLFFKGNSILFLKVATRTYIHTNSEEGFPFFPTISSIIIYRLFDDSHSNQYEVTLHYGSDWHFSNNMQC